MSTKREEQQHKQFFCDMMHYREVAKEFLQCYLNEEIQVYVDWKSLVPHEKPLYSKETERYAHVLYRANTKDERSTLYFILNHLYIPDPCLHLNALGYVLTFLEENMERNPAHIIQFTTYNGLAYPYPHPKTYYECFQSPELARELHLHGPIIVDTPENPYPSSYPRTVFDYYEDRELATKVFFEAHRIIDFRDYTDEVLLSHPHLSALSLAMKHVHDPALSDWIKTNQKTVQKLKESQYADQTWQYLLSS